MTGAKMTGLSENSIKNKLRPSYPLMTPLVPPYDLLRYTLPLPSEHHWETCRRYFDV